MTRPRDFAVLPSILLLLAAGLFAGCSTRHNPVGVADRELESGASALSSRAAEDGTSDGIDHAGRGFYPLALGNRWTFAVEERIRTGPPAGPLGDQIVRHDVLEKELVCTETAGGRDYVVEETRGATGLFTSWVRYRQDRAGLYELDVSVNTPPPCAPTGGETMLRAGEESPPVDEVADRIANSIADPARRAATLGALRTIRERVALLTPAFGGHVTRPRGGVADGEITRLAYPLRRGARWIIRDDPRFSAVVEGFDIVRTPNGPLPVWRVRIESVFFGPNDRVHQWFGRAGLVKLAVHVEATGTDENGQPVSRVVSDLVERLTDFHVARGPHAVERSPMEPVAAD